MLGTLAFVVNHGIRYRDEQRMNRIKNIAGAVGMTVTLPLGFVLAGAQAFADSPFSFRADDGALQCAISASGRSSNPYSESPHVNSWIELVVRPHQRRVHLISHGGFIDDAVAVWRKSLTDVAGSTISYQLGDHEPVDLVLPLTWSTPPTATANELHEDDLDGYQDERAAFDITRSALGRHLLEIDDSPPASLVIKHQAVFDHGYSVPKLLRYRMGSDTTTFTFKHFAESKAYCERANAGGGGFAGWFD